MTESEKDITLLVDMVLLEPDESKTRKLLLLDCLFKSNSVEQFWKTVLDKILPRFRITSTLVKELFELNHYLFSESSSGSLLNILIRNTSILQSPNWTNRDDDLVELLYKYSILLEERDEKWVFERLPSQELGLKEKFQKRCSTPKNQLDITADSLIAELESMEMGREDAYNYQSLVRRILEYLFDSALCEFEPEAGVDENRQRVDLIARNKAKTGFFSTLAAQKQIESNCILIEIKNYSNDIRIPEIAQLAFRLQHGRSNIGLLVFRVVEDRVKLFNNLNDHFNGRKREAIILPLSDEDLRVLLTFKGKNESNRIDDHLENLYTKIAFHRS